MKKLLFIPLFNALFLLSLPTLKSQAVYFDTDNISSFFVPGETIDIPTSTQIRLRELLVIDSKGNPNRFGRIDVISGVPYKTGYDNISYISHIGGYGVLWVANPDTVQTTNPITYLELANVRYVKATYMYNDDDAVLLEFYGGFNPDTYDKLGEWTINPFDNTALYYHVPINYNEEYLQGYNDGYNSGERRGYKYGHNDGYTEGYSDGWEDGEEAGLLLGYEDAFEAGKRVGSEETFLANFDKWIVPAIITVMILGGFFTISRMKRDGDY